MFCGVFFSHELFSRSSEIIIAGFDEGTNVSSYIRFRLIVKNCGKIIYEILDYRKSIKKPLIISFGDDNEVKIFLNGLDPNLEKFIYNFFEISLKSTIWDLFEFLDEYGQLDEEVIFKIKNAITEFSKYENVYSSDLKNELKNWKKDRYNPIFNLTESLPKDLLIDFAVSLINLTSNKRKFSLDVENVGGNIGLALIDSNCIKLIDSKHVER